MPRAERRRRSDLVAAAVLVLALAVGVAVVALVSPAAHTISRPATAAPPPVPAAPATVPATLAEAWRAPSSATHSPVVVGGTVVTGDDSEVIGRDPSNGAQRWLYRRDLPLCTVGSGWGMALAVFRNGPWCSDVAALRADTGARGPQRNSDAPTDTRLLDDGFLVTSTGADHLETWRSDLVRTLEYGRLRAPVQPKSQPRPACVHGSVAVTGGRLGVVERCPGEAGDRLTVLSPDGAESDHPEEEFSAVLPATGARLVALSADREAVLLPGPPRLSVRGADGAELASYPLPLPEGDLTGDPPGEAVPTTRIPGAVLWWTGSRTIALDENDLRPRWTMPGALGPGALFADEPVLPVPDGLVVVNPANGAVLKRVPVHRDDRTGVAAAPLGLASVGPVLLEQRGSTLVALH